MIDEPKASESPCTKPNSSWHSATAITQAHRLSPQSWPAEPPPPPLLGGMAAGDVKLMAAIGLLVLGTQTPRLLGLPTDYRSIADLVRDLVWAAESGAGRVVKRLLAERPKARGLTVPGMPIEASGCEITLDSTQGSNQSLTIRVPVQFQQDGTALTTRIVTDPQIENLENADYDVGGAFFNGTDVITASCSSSSTQRWRVDADRGVVTVPRIVCAQDMGLGQTRQDVRRAHRVSGQHPHRLGGILGEEQHGHAAGVHLPRQSQGLPLGNPTRARQGEHHRGDPPALQGLDHLPRVHEGEDVLVLVYPGAGQLARHELLEDGPVGHVVRPG